MVAVTSNRLLVDGVHRDWLRRKYVQALVRYAGVSCVILPTIDAEDARADIVQTMMRRVDGLVLTGDESNIDPAILTAPTSGSVTSRQDVEFGICDRPRDRLSSVAIERAVALGMPILGICRGLQELNVYYGGTLHSSLSQWNPDSGQMHAENADLPRDRQYDVTHGVKICSDGALFAIADATEAQVNSLHNQGIAKLADALKREAWTSDGLVEAASIANAPTLQIGVQWHPEWHAATDPLSQRIFSAFGAACVAYCQRNNR
ncbi:gamma-glutamyl-gamma-aminobutyrate hydrolase family protein [Bradyrhizobium genosp. P]|uniref:gamma-glutamyl-gamma-aminobutyrate hydrolase family protein n=1 Tax=Bradyrhizobium genosp. P TaxID=83641 RepID=UPI003CFB213F